MAVARLVDRIRRPEYTGENRCLPCTAVNLLVGAAAAVAASLLVDGVESVAVGGAVFLVSAGAIALRGYLVPGTPWFTRRFLPDWLLRRFDDHPAGTAMDGVDVEGALVGAGVLTDCEHDDDLCLTAAFQSSWRGRLDDLEREDTSRADIADVLGVAEDQLSFSEHGEALVAFHYSEPVGQWESRAAFLADVAAARELAGRVDGWERLPVDERGQLLAGVRLFVESCPTCGGPVELEETVTESCCRSIDVVAATCGDCGARLFEGEVGGPA